MAKRLCVLLFILSSLFCFTSCNDSLSQFYNFMRVEDWQNEFSIENNVVYVDFEGNEEYQNLDVIIFTLNGLLQKDNSDEKVKELTVKPGEKVSWSLSEDLTVLPIFDYINIMIADGEEMKGYASILLAKDDYEVDTYSAKVLYTRLNNDYDTIKRLRRQLAIENNSYHYWKGILINGTKAAGFQAESDFDGVLKIPEGIEEITANAFNDEETIESVILPSTLKEIGETAFRNCTNLKTVTGLLGVEHINRYAFENCSSLVSMSELCEHVAIYGYAFSGCKNLQSINLPSQTRLVGNGIFADCDNLDITVDPNNDRFKVENNVLYDYDMKGVYASGNVPETITLPDTVEIIYPYAFYRNGNINSLIVNQKIIAKEYSFASCSNLESIYFNTREVPSINVLAFSETNTIAYVPKVIIDSYNEVFRGSTVTVKELVQ